jgi:ribosomal protein L14E/L6E/L27E
MDMTKGSIVLANAGRDQDGVFFVVGEADGFVLLADGKRRKLEHPKRKNPVHICPVLSEGFDHVVIRKLQEGTPVTNRELRQALAAFKEGNTLG